MLYVAGAVEVFGTSGGSIHIQEVACGLRALGHEVLVLSLRGKAGDGSGTLECGVPVRATRWRKELALLGLPKVRRAMRAFRPDVVMERFYNFAGAGVLASHRQGIPSLLEVNAPMTDPPGSLKTRLDRLLLGSMRRWAVAQGRWSDAIVTPLASTVPPEVGREKIHELPWGANVERFDPARRLQGEERQALAAELGLALEHPVAAFLGSFRRWHGVEHFAEAARRLIDGGAPISFLAVGGGPELEGLRARVASWGLPPGRFVFTGPQPHERVPELLSLADIGVAPFDVASHAPLAEYGFYWSPLKVFEYMAMALPVVTIDTPPLNDIVREGQEGLLFPTGDIDGLISALARLAGDAGLRERLGQSGRQRVVANYSWQAHCAALDRLLRKIAHA
ncbi:MAG TPA: glycosyltransferase family 4 protein [Chloroflexia bacterium]|nr:glycosyltransferase family 4 protein [Chloroflexia bacterium]